MKICYFGTYRKDYARNTIMIAALEQSGHEVVQCHAKLWRGIQDRVEITQGGWKKPSFWWRVFRAYWQLIWRFTKVRDFDILMVGYPGQFDVFLAKIFAVLRRKPLVWDVLMSIYLVAKERGLDHESQFTVRMIRWFESRALRLPDRLIQDTAEYVAWLAKEFDLSPDRFRLVPIGADDRIFKPQPKAPEQTGSEFVVLYYGTFIPNHGVMKIAEAVNQLKDRNDIRFEFIGEGPEKPLLEAYIEENCLHNTRLLEWMSQENLLYKIAAADVCLGTFGDTPQSLMTVQNKIIECLAMGKPVVNGDSPAVRNSLPAETLILCNRDNPAEIAEAILSLKADPAWRQSLSEHAVQVFYEHYSISSLGDQLTAHLEELLASKNGEE